MGFLLNLNDWFKNNVVYLSSLNSFGIVLGWYLASDVGTINNSFFEAQAMTRAV